MSMSLEKSQVMFSESTCRRVQFSEPWMYDFWLLATGWFGFHLGNVNNTNPPFGIEWSPLHLTSRLVDLPTTWLPGVSKNFFIDPRVAVMLRPVEICSPDEVSILNELVGYSESGLLIAPLSRYWNYLPACRGLSRNTVNELGPILRVQFFLSISS